MTVCSNQTSSGLRPRRALATLCLFVALLPPSFLAQDQRFELGLRVVALEGLWQEAKRLEADRLENNSDTHEDD